MKKKLLIILAVVFIICVAIALYFTMIKMDYTSIGNGYKTSYRSNLGESFTIKIEKDVPLSDCYFHVRNDNGDIISYEIKNKTEKKIVLKVKGLKEGTGSLSIFINEDPNNLDEILLSINDETDDQDLEEPTVELFYSMDLVFEVTSTNNIYIIDSGIYSVKDAEIIYEKGEFKLYGQSFQSSYRLSIPNAQNLVNFKTSRYEIIDLVDSDPDEKGVIYATITGNKQGTEKVLVSSPYDDVNVVLEIKSFKITESDVNYSIELLSVDGSDTVDLSAFFDGVDYTLMATTIGKLPIPISASIKEYAVMNRKYNDGNDICRIDLVHSGKNCSYVVSEKVSMDELLVDVKQMMESANIPLVEEVINNIDVKSYEYIEGKETYSIMYFVIEGENCVLTSDKATVEELKSFVENIHIKDLSEYKVDENVEK